MYVLTKTLVVELNDLSSINNMKILALIVLSLHFPPSPLKMKFLLLSMHI